MFKLILIDDEKFSLDALSCSIDWSGNGFELCGAFTDPNKALEYIKSNYVDLVITDINMPKMSGLELTEIIRNAYPHIKIAFLSAYSEFEYAQKAIDYTVCAYILKPLNSKELSNTLKKIHQSLEKEYNSFNSVSYDINSTKNAISEFFLKNNFTDNEKLYNDLLKCGLNIDENSTGALVELQLDNLDIYLNTLWKHGILRLYSALDNLYTGHKLYVSPISYSFDKIKLFIICPKDISESFPELLLDFENSLVHSCTDLLSLSIQLEIENIFNSILDINLFTENTLFEKATQIFDAIKAAESKQDLENIFISNILNVNDENKQIIAKMLILKFTEICDDKNLNEISLLLFELIKSRENSSLVFKNIVHKLFTYFRASPSHEEETINMCKQYIQNNYNKNIGLMDVAEHVHLSAAYVSRLFKTKTQKKYIDYLNEIRVENAKSLLVFSNEKIKDISTKVGYGSYPYFLRLFKLYTGFTPLEYREKHIQNNQEG